MTFYIKTATGTGKRAAAGGGSYGGSVWSDGQSVYPDCGGGSESWTTPDLKKLISLCDHFKINAFSNDGRLTS